MDSRMTRNERKVKNLNTRVPWSQGKYGSHVSVIRLVFWTSLNFFPNPLWEGRFFLPLFRFLLKCSFFPRIDWKWETSRNSKTKMTLKISHFHVEWEKEKHSHRKVFSRKNKANKLVIWWRSFDRRFKGGRERKIRWYLFLAIVFAPTILVDGKNSNKVSHLLCFSHNFSGRSMPFFFVCFSIFFLKFNAFETLK